ncbi:hypothetical protein Ddye_007661 [Dipteronia dyeriana]|uniref:K Homology domain-containing protein n=1 Tax=Dipteronia dyeriana TaxID=168575 RepID=A0AAD9XKU7_9ROSI|nr:hypothetical protein Ddye_007661 [Dipteronia dyeriana]
MKIKILNIRVGVIIGKGGETIKYLQIQSGAKIQADPNSPCGVVELMGTSEQISKAEQLINDVLAEVHIDGTSEQIESAKQSINEVISEDESINIEVTLCNPNDFLVHIRATTFESREQIKNKINVILI